MGMEARKAVAPKITDEQRDAALARATEVRVERGRCLRAIKAGEMRPEAFLAESPVAATTRVRRFIESWPGYGRAKAAALMAELGIPEGRRIRGLGRRQRQALVDRALQTTGRE